MLTKNQLVWLYRVMYTSRRLDGVELRLKKQGRAYFQINSCGHEALGAAIALALKLTDWFFGYYRDQAVAIGRGYTAEQTLLDAVGAANAPSSLARQMPSHWGFGTFVSVSSPTGSQMLPAVGSAEATRYYEKMEIGDLRYTPGEVTLVTVGDGAFGEGECKEALEAACIRNLPVVFVVEDNGLAISEYASDLTPGGNVARNVAGMHSLLVEEVDGLDPVASYETLVRAIEHARRRQGPVLIRATVVRTYGHSSSDYQEDYRPAADIIRDILKDAVVFSIDDYPISDGLKTELKRIGGVRYGTFGEYLVKNNAMTEGEIDALRAEVDNEIEEAERCALAAPRPDTSRVMEHLYSEHVSPASRVFVSEPHPAPREEPISMVKAINRTLHDQMLRNPRIVIFGQDVADAPPDAPEKECKGEGGVFRATRGLQRAFGSHRVFNVYPEASIIGRAVGMALRGLHPSPEIEFADYFGPALHQLECEVKTLRWRSGGKFSCPMVIRTTVGSPYSGGTAIWHSQCGESKFAHTPGMWVVFPSSAEDAAGLLRTAFSCEDPVLMCEHKGLYRLPLAKGAYPGPDYTIPFGRAITRREGKDLTIVTYGYTVYLSLEAAENLAGCGVSVEVIDLRTVLPWDFEAVVESVEKTNRLLVVHEDMKFCGFGAEISASIAENPDVFSQLAAPIGRVASLNCWDPYEPTLEAAVLPQISDIEKKAREILDF